MTDDITTGKIRVGNIEIYISRDGQDATLEEAAQALAEAQASINGILQDLRGGQITTTPISDMIRAFKAGDVVTLEHADARCLTAIIKGFIGDYEAILLVATLDQDWVLCVGDEALYESIEDITKIRPATDDERKRLTDALRDEQCLMWSDEANSLVRWRAAHLGSYYTMDHSCLQVIQAYDDSGDIDSRDVDSNRYALGNYYPTREMAERQAERIRAIHATPYADKQDA